MKTIPVCYHFSLSDIANETASDEFSLRGDYVLFATLQSLMLWKWNYSFVRAVGYEKIVMVAELNREGTYEIALSFEGGDVVAKWIAHKVPNLSVQFFVDLDSTKELTLVDFPRQLAINPISEIPPSKQYLLGYNSAGGQKASN